ncbi:hypothetical protein EVAR_46530_1, partial [Eumeta japonica]
LWFSKDFQIVPPIPAADSRRRPSVCKLLLDPPRARTGVRPPRARGAGGATARAPCENIIKANITRTRICRGPFRCAGIERMAPRGLEIQKFVDPQVMAMVSKTTDQRTNDEIGSFQVLSYRNDVHWCEIIPCRRQSIAKCVSFRTKILKAGNSQPVELTSVTGRRYRRAPRAAPSAGACRQPPRHGAAGGIEP